MVLINIVMMVEGDNTLISMLIYISPDLFIISLAVFVTALISTNLV